MYQRGSSPYSGPMHVWRAKWGPANRVKLLISSQTMPDPVRDHCFLNPSGLKDLELPVDFAGYVIELNGEQLYVAVAFHRTTVPTWHNAKHYFGSLTARLVESQLDLDLAVREFDRWLRPGGVVQSERWQMMP